MSATQVFALLTLGPARLRDDKGGVCDAGASLRSRLFPRQTPPRRRGDGLENLVENLPEKFTHGKKFLFFFGKWGVVFAESMGKNWVFVWWGKYDFFPDFRGIE